MGGHKKIILALIIIILMGLIPVRWVSADLDTSEPHTSDMFESSSGLYSCRMCHIGYPDIQSTPSTRVFENYRCISCHLGLNTTSSIVYAMADSPHRTTGCTSCHDTYHSGHRPYSTSTPGFYGCYRSRSSCHEVITQDLNPPSSTTDYFLVTYLVRGVTSVISNIISSIRWFFSNGTGISVYTNSYIDPYTGNFNDIPRNKRYWVCLKCHFTVSGVRNTGAGSYWVSHPDKCYICHSNTSGYPSSLYTLDPHAVQINPENYTWSACGTCHNGVSQAVSSSLHANLGCRCHSTLHISRYNSTGSWLFFYEPGQGLYATPRNIIFQNWRKVFFYNQSNSSVLGVPILPINVSGDLRYVTPFYAMRNGDASLITGQSLRILTCFNCHFVYDTGSPSSINNVGGLIPIPASALEGLNNPHNIMSSGQSGYGGQSTGSNILFMAVVLLTIFLILSAIILGRRR